MQKDSIGLKIVEQNMVMAEYTDDIIIMSKTEDQVRYTAKTILQERKSIGVNINKDKSKYLFEVA